MTEPSYQIEFATLERALASLQAALLPPPRNDRERDGAIQRFEYSFELAWKTAKRALDEIGIVSNSPRSVIRDLAQQKLIDDPEIWFAFLVARNQTSHIYNEAIAEKVFREVQDFLPQVYLLLARLKQALSP